MDLSELINCYRQQEYRDEHEQYFRQAKLQIETLRAYPALQGSAGFKNVDLSMHTYARMINFIFNVSMVLPESEITVRTNDQQILNSSFGLAAVNYAHYYRDARKQCSVEFQKKEGLEGVVFDIREAADYGVLQAVMAYEAQVYAGARGLSIKKSIPGSEPLKVLTPHSARGTICSIVFGEGSQVLQVSGFEKGYSFGGDIKNTFGQLQTVINGWMEILEAKRGKDI